MDSLRDNVHFARGYQTNSLIELNNSDRSGNPLRLRGSLASKGLK
jgi:hypothetical protein